MTLYIGNTTRQHNHLEVRLPEGRNTFSEMIYSGRQIKVGSLSPGQEAALIEHISRYGAIERSKLHGKAKGFEGTVYSEKPLKMEEFHYGLEEVLDHAEDRAVTEAVKSAIAADKHMIDKQTGQRLSASTEIEMEEEHVKRGKKGRKMKLTVDPKAEQSDKVPLQ